MSYYIPSFNGDYIFGLDVKMVTGDPQRQEQMNKFLGVNGSECYDFGMTHFTTEVTGRLWGNGIDGLRDAENLFRSYRNPYAYVLVTTDGNTWYNVKLSRFRPNPGMAVDAMTGMAFRSYTAQFTHLSPFGYM